METKQDYEIRQTIKLIKEYIKKLTVLEEQQTDIADKLPFERMNQELSMAIKDLEHQLGREKEEKSVKLSTTVWSASAIKNSIKIIYLEVRVMYFKIMIFMFLIQIMNG